MTRWRPGSSPSRVRIARSRIKAQIAVDELTAAQVILSGRWEIERMPISEVLGSQPQWGAVQSRRFLAVLHIAEAKTIGSMTERQRLSARRDPTSSFAGRSA
jgi:hypothetical protein